MTDFDITKHEWSDSVSAKLLGGYSEHVELTNEHNKSVVINSSDTRALCQHHYGIDPEVVRWVSVDERLPTEADASISGSVIAWLDGFWSRVPWKSIERKKIRYWMPDPIPVPPQDSND